MSGWKTFEVRGTPRYMKDGKLIKRADIPPEILEELSVGVQLRTLAPASKVCIFCGEPGTKQRLVSLQTIDMCDEHYYSESIGRVTQQLRKVSNGKESTEQVGSSQKS